VLQVVDVRGDDHPAGGDLVADLAGVRCGSRSATRFISGVMMPRPGGARAGYASREYVDSSYDLHRSRRSSAVSRSATAFGQRIRNKIEVWDQNKTLRNLFGGSEPSVGAASLRMSPPSLAKTRSGPAHSEH
jgi:hypothetical protein